MALVVIPAHLSLDSQVFGLGIGVTAYTLGLRHAFDADHLAAIDNTTRKLLNDTGRNPVSVGFWFAMGHSVVVLLLAALIAAGIRATGALTSEGSGLHRAFGTAGTVLAGSFLYAIGVLNLVVLQGITRIFRRMRSGEFNEDELEEQLSKRGLLNRFLNGLTKSIRHPWQMFPLGLLFGLGFDTATEVTMLVLAGAGAASGLPWYAILVLPVLFAAGMTLLDTLDGLFMSAAYGWAFAKPIRKLYYNITITGFSVAIALIIGTIEWMTVVHDDLGMSDPVSSWVSSLDLNNVGFIIVGIFAVVWIGAVAYWKVGKVEQKYCSAADSSALAPDAASGP
ncbi:HoxN/HupN/NixA family nickel/cobalt transporter [Streptomyces sp. NBC_00154]|uniref:HoxN/HupN/NixA family nickel/cobalt transporter n=1 Tax=Streptomyces sp. NBC_00154 TaxID=2975670 RepID=UPI002B1D698F|nr:HoxN/HupN/NixA family nickel/cobalt transporter [Streptomyces sp. NBC_00154]